MEFRKYLSKDCSNYGYGITQIYNSGYDLFSYYYYERNAVVICSTDYFALMCENLPPWDSDKSFILFTDDFNNLTLINSIGEVWLSEHYTYGWVQYYPTGNEPFYDILPIYNEVMDYANNTYYASNIHELQEGEDLDDITTPGFYYTVYESIAETINNLPPYEANSYGMIFTFFLEVLEEKSGLYSIKQQSKY
jgi:hypothetical protein